jgi:Tfp pilus assembly protein PilV
MVARAMRGVGLVLVSVLTLAVSAAGLAGASGKSDTPTTALNQAAATRQVTADIVSLFNSNDKNENSRERVIEQASKYKAAFKKLFSSTVAKSNPTLAQVTAVTFPSTAACRAAAKAPVCAAVTYNIDIATTGSAILPGSMAYAVYVGGKWLVSDVSFCALAKLAKATC